MNEQYIDFNLDVLGGALIVASNEVVAGSKVTEDAIATYGTIEVFAMDTFADLFAAHKGGVIRIGTETGDVAETWPSLVAWKDDILSDPRAVGQSFLEMWEEVNGKLGEDQRLTPKMPIVFGGEYTVENMVPMQVQDILKFRSDIAEQIKGLPDGARIMLDT